MSAPAWLISVVMATTTPPPEGVEFKITARELASVSYEIRAELAGLHYLLNPYQLRQFFDLPGDAARLSWIERFWKSKDPTPATPDNPMRELHEERKKFAQNNYGVPDWPGWDDRGHMHVRYGAPDYRGRIASHISPHGVDLGVWLWYYEKHNMLVAFEYFRESGPHYFATSATGVDKFMTPQLVEFLVYDANPAYEGMIPIGILTPEYVTRRGILGTGEGRPPDYTPAEIDHLMHLGRKMEFDTKETLHDVPSSYPFSFEPEPFPFFFDVAQFKGGNRMNRIEVNVEFPIAPVADEEDARPGGQRRYDVRVVFFDPAYEEIDRRESTIDIPRAVVDEGRRLWPAQVFTSLPRDYYRVAVSIEEGDRSSSYWSNVAFREFGGALAVSDALFASHIGPAKGDSPFNRGALEVVPHPVRRYRQGDRLPVYFEIYNMRLEDGQSSYEVSYRIVPHSKKRSGFWDERGREPAIASSFDGTGYSSDEPLHLVVRTDNLEPGTYNFLVSVTDRIAADTVRRAASFKVVDVNFELAK